MKDPKNIAKSEKPLNLASPSSEHQILTLQEALNLAVAHHTANDLPKAKSIYLEILQADPNQPVGLHLLGVISHQLGINDRAVDLIKKALSIKPDYAKAHSNLGIVLHELKRFLEAVASYNQALSIKPNFAEAHYNLGNTFTELGRLDEAVICYGKALTIGPILLKRIVTLA